LSKRHENLYFSGEATSVDYFGTVNGAYITGLKQAEEIIKDFQNGK